MMSSIQADVLSAIATTAATAVALIFGVWGLWSASYQRRREQSDAIEEVMKASATALWIFEEASRIFDKDPAQSPDMLSIAPRAEHLRAALDRILNRPNLTDGAIVVGEAAISLMKGVLHGADALASNAPRCRAVAIERLQAVCSAESLLQERATRVARYALLRRLPKAQSRFGKIAREGLEPRA